MSFGWKWIYVTFVAFLLGKTFSDEIDYLSCGHFCLSAQTTCECRVNSGGLLWKVAPPNDTVTGERTLQPENLNETLPLFGASSFVAKLTDNSGGKLTATLSFHITNDSYRDYEIQCAGGSNVKRITTLQIEDVPPPVENLTKSEINATSDSLWFTFDPPPNAHCIDYYKVNTTADAPPNTTDTHVLVTKPVGDDSTTARYNIKISAVDIAGREGDQTSKCFMFTTDQNNVSCVDEGAEPSGSSVLPFIGFGGLLAGAIVGIIAVFAVSGM